METTSLVIVYVTGFLYFLVQIYARSPWRLLAKRSVIAAYFGVLTASALWPVFAGYSFAVYLREIFREILRDKNIKDEDLPPGN